MSQVTLPLETAVLLVELAEEIGDLSAPECAALADARDRIERAARRHSNPTAP